MRALELSGVDVQRGGRRVLEGISFGVDAGEVVAVVGRSGAGKSSLLRCIVRLDEPAAGRVLVENEDARLIDPCLLRRRVGLVTQTPVMLPGTVADNLAYGLDAEPDSEVLEAVGLDAGFAVREARKLSGGEAARVAIARALVRGPRVLLLDEATAALDVPAARGIEQLVRELAERGLAVLMVTHDEAQAARLGARNERVGA